MFYRKELNLYVMQENARIKKSISSGIKQNISFTKTEKM